MTKKLIIVGSGGHAGVVLEAIADWNSVFGLVDSFEKLGTNKHGRVIIQAPHDPWNYQWHVAIGDNRVREGEFQKYPSLMVTILHPFSTVLRGVEIGVGSFVAGGALIANGTSVGKGCIINTASSVDHDCVIKDFAHVGPGVSVGGGTEIGHGSWIGIGACLRDHIKIGDNSVIGMGSVVTKDIPDSVVAYGNPCKVMRQCA